MSLWAPTPTVPAALSWGWKLSSNSLPRVGCSVVLFSEKKKRERKKEKERKKIRFNLFFLSFFFPLSSCLSFFFSCSPCCPCSFPCSHSRSRSLAFFSVDNGVFVPGFAEKQALTAAQMQVILTGMEAASADHFVQTAACQLLRAVVIDHDNTALVEFSSHWPI